MQDQDANLWWTASSSFCFRESDTGPVSRVSHYLMASNHLTYTSLVCFCESGIISRHRIILASRFTVFVSLRQLRLFSASQTWTVWHKATAYSRITSRSFSAGFLDCPWVEIFRIIYNFTNALVNRRGNIFVLFSLGNGCVSCYATQLMRHVKVTIRSIFDTLIFHEKNIKKSHRARFIYFFDHVTQWPTWWNAKSQWPG